MKLEQGTKVKCVRNTFDSFPSNGFAYPYLTIGKTYTVRADFGPTLAIVADNGQGLSLLKELFLTLEDYRNKQIQILEQK